MTEKEISVFLASYILSNWQVIIVSCFSFIGTIVLSTWFVARHWYQREITHIEKQKESVEELSDKECSYLSRQVQDKESYAKGVIEVMNQRLALAEEKPKNLLKIIQAKDAELLKFKNKYREQQVLIEKAKSNSSIVVNKISTAEIILASCSSLKSDIRFKKVDEDYHSLINNKNRDKRETQIIILSSLVTLLTSKVIEDEILLKNNLLDYEIENIELIKHFIRVIIPLVDKSITHHKLLLSDFSKALEETEIGSDIDSVSSKPGKDKTTNNELTEIIFNIQK